MVSSQLFLVLTISQCPCSAQLINVCQVLTTACQHPTDWSILENSIKSIPILISSSPSTCSDEEQHIVLLTPPTHLEEDHSTVLSSTYRGARSLLSDKLIRDVLQLSASLNPDLTTVAMI